MKTELGKQLHQLGRYQQKKIWLDRIIARTPALLWWSAIILFLGGCIHQSLSPLNPLIVVCIALIPSLLIFALISVCVKPSADEGAAAADRLLGANSLLVSAWELSCSSNHVEGIGRLLLTRTETALPDWLQAIKQQPQRYMKFATLAASSLAAVGIFFLLLPSQIQPEEVISATPPQKQIFNSDKYQNKDPAVALSELFMYETATATRQQQQKTVPDAAKAGNTQLSPGKQAVSAANNERGSQDEEQKPANSTAPQQPSITAQKILSERSSQAQGKKIADRTAGNQAAIDSGKVTNKAEVFGQTDHINIETATDSQTTAFDNSQKGDELIISAAQQNTFRQAENNHSLNVSQTASGTLLSAEQRALVWRYFKQLEKINETNE